MKKNLFRVAISIVMATIIMVASVAALYYYDTKQNEATITVQEIANITLNGAGLGTIEEGQTLTLTKAQNASLGSILSLTTTKDNVYLSLTSDISSLSTKFNTFTVVVKCASKAVGSSITLDTSLGQMTIAVPNMASAITLDKAGTYTFDFEVSLTALTVTTDQAATATITAKAQNAAS